MAAGSVTFSAAVTGATATSYLFDFGDGGSDTKSVASATHSYISAGPFTATVTVTASSGATAVQVITLKP